MSAPLSYWCLHSPNFPFPQRPIACYVKPNGRSQKTIRKQARYIRSQHQKRK